MRNTASNYEVHADPTMQISSSSFMVPVDQLIRFSIHRSDLWQYVAPCIARTPRVLVHVLCVSLLRNRILSLNDSYITITYVLCISLLSCCIYESVG